jgi:Na+-transporting NADH:ubiquinone oxidoreductase subunit NqrA
MQRYTEEKLDLQDLKRKKKKSQNTNILKVINCWNLMALRPGTRPVRPTSQPSNVFVY